MLNNVSPNAQAMLGATLVTTPGWAMALQNISLIASTIAAICGAVVGLHAVWRICRKKRGER